MANVIADLVMGSDDDSSSLDSFVSKDSSNAVDLDEDPKPFKSKLMGYESVHTQWL